jgi:hypothetical protein
MALAKLLSQDHGSASCLDSLNSLENYQENQFATLHLEGPAFDWWKMIE